MKNLMINFKLILPRFPTLKTSRDIFSIQEISFLFRFCFMLPSSLLYFATSMRNKTFPFFPVSQNCKLYFSYLSLDSNSTMRNYLRLLFFFIGKKLPSFLYLKVFPVVFISVREQRRRRYEASRTEIRNFVFILLVKVVVGER